MPQKPEQQQPGGNTRLRAEGLSVPRATTAIGTLPACVGPSPPEPTTTAGWTAVSSVAAASFTLILSQFIVIAVLPDVVRQFGVSAGAAGLTVVLPGLLAAVAAPALAMVFGSMDRRVVLWGITGIVALSDLLAALAPSFALVMVARLLLGAAIGAFWTMGAGVGPRLVPAARVTRATSLIMAGISAGTVVSLPAGNLVAQHWGWRPALFGAGVLSVLVLLLQFRVLPRMPAGPPLRPRGVLALLHRPQARIGLVLAALLFFGHFGAYTFVSSYLAERAGFSASTVAVLLLLYGIAGFAGNFTAGAAVDRSLPVTLGTAAAVLALSVFALGQWHAQPLVIVALCAWGFGFGAVPLSLQTTMMRGEAAEGGLALFVTVSQLSLAAGSFVGGLVVDHAGVATAYLIFALPAAAAVFVAATGARRLR